MSQVHHQRHDVDPNAGQWAVDVIGSQVVLVIYGSGDRPHLFELGDRLGASLNQPVNMSLIAVPSEQEDYVAVRE